jgi:hypothetical protein
VLEWLPLGDGVRVITDHGVYETDHLGRVSKVGVSREMLPAWDEET